MDPSVDIQGYETFAISPLPDSIPGGDPGMMLRYGHVIEKGIRLALIAKGYTEAASVEEADFAVNMKGHYVPKTKITDYGMGGMGYSRRGYWGGYSYPYGGGIDVDNYEEGTLILEIFDGKTKELAWVGWGVGRKKSKPSEDEAVYSTLEKILTSFPVN